MPYNFYADDIHINKLCNIISSRKVHFLRENTHFGFLKNLRATHAVHLKLSGKRIVDFLLAIIELFR